MQELLEELYASANLVGLYPAGLTGDDVDPCEGRRHNFAKKVHLNRGVESPDVLQYRYSKGICPDAYKVCTLPHACSICLLV